MMLTRRIRGVLERLGLLEPQTAKNARQRLEMHLNNKVVLSRRREEIGAPGVEKSSAFVVTVAPFEQRFTPLADQDLRRIKDDAKRIGPFMSFHGVHPSGQWSLEDLDAAFSAWTESGKKVPYSDDDVIEIAGAAFGEYCAEHLDMEWVLVEDGDGTATGLRGRKILSQSYPFASVAKRVRVREHGFFKPVFLLIQHQAAKTASRVV